MRRCLLQALHQLTALGRSISLPFFNNLRGGYALAVQFLICSAVRPQSRPFQRNTGERSTRSGIAKHLRSQGHIVSGRGGAAFGSRRYASVSAELYLAVQHAVQSAIVHYQNYEVGRLSTDLEPYAATFQSHHRRRAPRSAELLASTAHHNAAAIAATYHERSLYHRGQHHYAARLIQNVLRDIIGNIQDLFHYFTGVYQALAFVLVTSRSCNR